MSVESVSESVGTYFDDCSTDTATGSVDEKTTLAAKQAIAGSSNFPVGPLSQKKCTLGQKETIPEGCFSPETYPLFEEYMFKQVSTTYHEVAAQINERLGEERLKIDDESETQLKILVIVHEEINMKPGRNHPSGGAWTIYLSSDLEDVSSEKALQLTYRAQKDGFFFQAGPPTLSPPIMGTICMDPTLQSDLVTHIKMCAKQHLSPVDEKKFEQTFVISNSYDIDLDQDSLVSGFHVRACEHELAFAVSCTPQETGGTDFTIYYLDPEVFYER